MRRTLLLGVALVALLAPAGTVAGSDDTQTGNEDWDQLFQGVPSHMDIIVGPDAIRITLEDISIDGDYAAKLRQAIDQQLGDGDGEVSASEVGMVQSFLTAYVNAQLPSSFDMELMRLDGRAPYSEEVPPIHLEYLTIHGAEGSVTSTDQISADVSALLRFESVDQSKTVHELDFRNVWGDVTGFDVEHAPDMEIRVQGYRSWEILEDTIDPPEMQDRFENGVLVFTGADVSHFETDGNGVKFDIKGDSSDQILTEVEESPAVAPIVLLVFALVGLAAWRRR